MDITREDMIVKNLPLVAFVVGRMSDESASGAMDRDDAVAYGVEGLIQAVDNYDPTRGTTFASFAIRRIRGSILDAIRRLDMLPRSLRRSAREVDRANLELASMLGRWPTLKELSLRVNLSVEELRGIFGHTGTRVVSLEKMMGDTTSEGSTPWEASDQDEFSDPALYADRQAVLQILEQALNDLPARDRQIIELRYIRNLAFHEIGKIMSLSESRVCQLHKRILTGLHHRLVKDSELAA